MTKQELLEQIKNFSSQHLVTKDEIVNAYLDGQGPKGTLLRNVTLSKVLYYIGGAIIFLGICVFVGENWAQMGFGTKILVTLGSAIAAYIAALGFIQRPDTGDVGQAFFLISALVAPLGLFVLFDKLGFDTNQSSTQTIMAALLFVVYFLSLWKLRRTVFQIFLFTFGTWLFFSVSNLVINGSSQYPAFDTATFYEYRYLVTGLAYMLFGYWFSQRQDSSLSGALYGFGSLFFLGSALFLGGWSISDSNTFWMIVYPGLVFGIIILSVYIKSKSFLTFGAIFLMVYILKLTAIYFSESLGWPLALVIAGLLLIAIGYYSVYIGKRYITEPPQSTPKIL